MYSLTRTSTCPLADLKENELRKTAKNYHLKVGLHRTKINAIITCPIFSSELTYPCGIVCLFFVLERKVRLPNSKKADNAKPMIKVGPNKTAGRTVSVREVVFGI